MSGETITLTIEKLAGLGDGVGTYEGQRVFVPYTLAGDTVRADIGRVTKDVSYAALAGVITPSASRIVPVCRHFTHCGGCALQHANAETYADFKQQTAREAVRKAGFDPQSVMPLVQLPAASRRRVDLKAHEGKLGYYAGNSHRLIDIQECKVLEPALEALILRLKPWLARLPGLTGVQINGVDDGYDILLSSDADAEWPSGDTQGIRRISARKGAKLSTLYQAGPVTVTLANVAVAVPPGAFLQASREAQAIMTQAVLESGGQGRRVLDLFAGIGTYSFPLATFAQVVAVEGDAAMVAAMGTAAEQARLESRLKAIKQDLFVNPVTALDGYDAIVINPPRLGAKAQIEKIARAKVKRLVMVSCNPATFTRDAKILREGGYLLNKVLPIDQFVYTPHLEIVAEFSI